MSLGIAVLRTVWSVGYMAAECEVWFGHPRVCPKHHRLPSGLEGKEEIGVNRLWVWDRNISVTSWHYGLTPEPQRKSV